MDFVSRRELSSEVSIDSIEAMSTSVARGRAHDVEGGIAIRRPAVYLAVSHFGQYCVMRTLPYQCSSHYQLCW